MKAKFIINGCILVLSSISSAYAVDSLSKEEAYETTLEGLKGVSCEMVVPYMRQMVEGMQVGYQAGMLTKRDFENSIQGSTLAATKYAKDNCPELYDVFQKASK